VDPQENECWDAKKKGRKSKKGIFGQRNNGAASAIQAKITIAPSCGLESRGQGKNKNRDGKHISVIGHELRPWKKQGGSGKKKHSAGGKGQIGLDWEVQNSSCGGTERVPLNTIIRRNKR